MYKRRQPFGPERDNYNNSNNNNNNNKSIRYDHDAICERTMNMLRQGSECMSENNNNNVVDMCASCNNNAKANNYNLICSFCNKQVCPSCTKQCNVCQDMFCSFCSENNYDLKYDRVLCITCKASNIKQPTITTTTTTTTAAAISTTTATTLSNANAIIIQKHGQKTLTFQVLLLLYTLQLDWSDSVFSEWENLFSHFSYCKWYNNYCNTKSTTYGYSNNSPNW